MNNVVAKILIVAQLVFSLCFMCFAGAVYTFQAGWKGKAEATQGKLDNATQNITSLQDAQVQAAEKSKADLESLKSRAEVAEAQVTQLQTNLQQALANQASAEQQRDKHLADLVVAQQEAQARFAETTDSRSEIKRLRDQRNEDIALRRQLEDTNLDLNGKLAEAGDRELQMLKEIGRQRDLLRFSGVDPATVAAGPIPAAIEKVSGLVKDARKNASRSAEWVEVSIGSDDGITEKTRLIVFRGSDYICEIEVTDVSPDTAIGRVLEETRNGTIERGDNVTTKL